MTTFLSNGWTLTIIAVSVVFLALFILFLLYSLSGKILGEKKTELEQSDNDADVAAIMGVLMEMQSSVHDTESGIITIQHEKSAWDDRSRNFRKYSRQ